jgi:branched-chain amino acid transport system ATP-binding protein
MPRLPSTDAPMLRVSGLKVAYGGIQAVKGASFEVREGELVSLIGANGAGKTTTLKAITGTQPAADGTIEFRGRSIRGQGAWELVRQGLVMVPEGRGTFARMTIRENLLMGAYVRDDAEIDADIERVYALFPRLEERARQLAGTMSGGEQQMLAMGRALMARPRLLLLDEPSMGLAPQIVEEIFEILRSLNEKEDVSFLLAEQNTNIALRYASYGYILESGRIVLDGTAEDLRSNQDVKDFYLGVAGGDRKSFRDVKHYKRRKRWLA